MGGLGRAFFTDIKFHRGMIQGTAVQLAPVGPC